MQKKEQHGGKIHKDGQHQTTPHTLWKLKIIKRERSRRHRGPSPRMLHQEQYHTGSEERGVDTSRAYAVTMHLQAPARHIRYTIFEEGHYLLARIEGDAPSQDEMDAARRWPHREGQRTPNETRRLSLSRTSPLHTSNTGGGSFTLGQEGHTVAAAHQPHAQAPQGSQSGAFKNTSELGLIIYVSPNFVSLVVLAHYTREKNTSDVAHYSVSSSVEN